MRTPTSRTKAFASLLALACLAAFSLICFAQENDQQPPSPRVPIFSDYPFEQWAAAPEHSAIKWETHLLPPQLSVHQRLIENVQAVIPGAELEKRRGRGELVMLVRFEDPDSRHWNTGVRLNLKNVQQGVKSQELTFTIAAFIRPGDYKVFIALLDTQTQEHNFIRKTLHVTSNKTDPLPDAWNTLPSVEILPAVEDPDTWFLPTVKGLLHLPLGKTAKPPPRVDLVVNMTPSERSASTVVSARRNMAAVVPALKVLSAMNAERQPPGVAVLDLARQRIAFQATNSARLDWNALRGALMENHPGLIDARSLAAQATMRDYFAREVTKRAVTPTGAFTTPHWIFVLSGPLAFSKQEDTPLPELPPDPNRHIVYLRFSSGFGAAPRGGLPEPPPDIAIGPVHRVHGPMPGFGTVSPRAGGRGRGGPGLDAGYPDDLERILRPMGARIFSVATPDAFRKLLAELIDEMSAN